MVLSVIAVGQIVRDLTHPYKHRCDWDHQGFARWFWSQDNSSAELLPMPHQLNAEIYNQSDYSAYLCYQAIYGRKTKSDSAGLESQPRPKTLDYVVFHSDESQPEQRTLNAWLDQMEPNYSLAGCTRYRVKTDVGPPHDFYGWYDVYRFCLKEPASRPELARQQPSNATLR